MKKRFYYCLLFAALFSCKGKKSDAAEEAPAAPETPVTVTSINNEPMEEFVELNATSTYLQKWPVKSNLNGYLQSVSVQLNSRVGSGQTLFTVKTKEAKSIGNTINILDSSFRFSGTNRVAAPASGFVSEVDRQRGDYVQEGEQLAMITDTRSFVFLLDLPYELRQYMVGKTSLQMQMPDGEKMIGVISGSMPSMDSASQTQRIILKVKSAHPLPENLIAKVKIVKSTNPNAPTLPKSAVLTDETQSEFWVMKMLNDSTAAKVPVKKGIEAGDKVEIISPMFAGNDKILISGNYGLADTARVKIIAAAKE